jgi:hypothetical protein
MPNFPSIYALRYGIEFLLQVGTERIYRELFPLVKRLRLELGNLGVDLLTPEDDEFRPGSSPSRIRKRKRWALRLSVKALSSGRGTAAFVPPSICTTTRLTSTVAFKRSPES